MLQRQSRTSRSKIDEKYLGSWKQLNGMERELARCEVEPFYFVRKYITTTFNQLKAYGEKNG